jgi:hypothetical protein
MVFRENFPVRANGFPIRRAYIYPWRENAIPSDAADILQPLPVA